MAASMKQPKLTEAHGPGARACIVWDLMGEALITAGEDARLLVHNLGGGAGDPKAANVRHQQAITSLSMSPSGRLLASASLDRTVKVYTYPGVEFQSDITRFTLPIRCLAFSITGGLLAAAGDDDQIKLISTVDSSIVRVMKGHEAPVVSLAFDPKNDILASVDSDGTVSYWSLETGARLHTLKHAAPDVALDEAGRNEIAWHPSGDVLAIPGHQFDVVMHDRDTAEERFRLRGGHNTAIGCLAWSPNGKYLATAGQDRKVMVWDAEKKQDLDRLKVISPITSLSWKPTGNAVAIIDAEGRFGVWEDAIPSHLASPSDLQQPPVALSRRELLHFSDDEALERENSASGYGSADDSRFSREEDLLDGDDSGEEEDLLKVKETKELKKLSSKMPKSKESRLLKESSAMRVKKEKVRSDTGLETVLAHQPCAHNPRPEKQGPFQPGSTQQPAGMRRFLAYNLMGCISSFEKEGISHVEVEFHDTSRGHRVPSMADYYGFTMAALGDKGSILANPVGEVKKPSTLVYRPFSSWASNSEWSMRFPLNEEVRAVAVGDQWAAAATSLNYLRIYSETGLQKFVLSLTGSIVAMASHQQLLALVTHASDPFDSEEQVMEFVVLDVCNNQRVLAGTLPLTPGAKLTWLGFSESGTLSSYDSKGVLRMFSTGYGGCWIPVFSVSTEQENTGESLWVVGLDSTQLYCVKCKAPDLQPQVHPKPILATVNFSLPLAHSDLGAADLENELVRRSLLLTETYARADEAAARGEDDDDDQDQVLKLEAELDRCLLRLIAASCQGDKLARALELATMLSLHKSLEGAIKIVTAMRLPSLAERLNTMLEGRRNLEKSVPVPLKLRETGSVHSPLLAQSSSLKVHAFPSEPVSCRSTPLVPPTKRCEAPKTLIERSEIRRFPQPLERPSTPKPTGNIVDNSHKNVLPEPKSCLHPNDKQESVKEANTSALQAKSGQDVPGSSLHKSSNPFVKPSNPFAKPPQSKQGKIASDTDVSVLDSLKKIQKTGSDIDSKRKTASANTPLQRPAKATKAS